MHFRHQRSTLPRQRSRLKPIAPESGVYGRDDGIARPSQGRLNKSGSEDRATGYDSEVVLGHQKTSEEASGRVNQPQQRLHQRWRERRHRKRKTDSHEWERFTHTRDKRDQMVRRGRSPCMKSSKQAQAARSGDTFGSKQNVTVVPAPEDVQLDAESVEEDSQIPVETERCPEPRIAKSRTRARRSRGSEGGAHVAAYGPVQKMLWRTGPRPARARHKAIKSCKLDA